MKPPPFAYVRPASVEEAVGLLEGADGDGKLLAGGQSLVPLLNFRLAAPSLLIDLNALPDLAYVRREDGGLRIGAMTRTRRLEQDAAVRQAFPVLAEAASWVGHVQIRNRGTVGGSIAHADPAAELPAAALLLEAELEIATASGSRTVPAAGFFQGFFTTLLAPDEVLTAIRVPSPGGRTTWGFHEFAHRHGDFALAGAACQLGLADDGTISRAALVVFGLGDRPVRIPGAEAPLASGRLDDAAIRDAVGLTADAVAAIDDQRADAGYRRQVAAVMMRRALEDAARRTTA